MSFDWRPSRQVVSLAEGSRGSGARRGKVGLANEVRPVLGTRADSRSESSVATNPTRPDHRGVQANSPRAKKRGYERPRPAPREQPAHSMAHELEREAAFWRLSERAVQEDGSQ